MYPSAIRLSTNLLLLAAGVALIWACAKGSDIAQAEIVFLSLEPAGAVDAGADAAPPVEP